jgi:hypothetical protein
MGSDGGSYPLEPLPYAAPPAASGKAVAALVLGLVAFFCCTPLGPVAWFLGASERAAIRAGYASPAGDGFALAGMIFGIICTVLLILGLLAVILWIVVFGGLAIIAAAAGAH